MEKVEIWYFHKGTNIIYCIILNLKEMFTQNLIGRLP